MGGRWSIEARNLNDDSWCVADYYCNLFQFAVKGLYCLMKYQVVILGKHG